MVSLANYAACASDLYIWSFLYCAECHSAEMALEMTVDSLTGWELR